MVGCFWIGSDEGSFRWNMEWVVGSGKEGGEKCRGTSLGEQSGGY